MNQQYERDRETQRVSALVALNEAKDARIAELKRECDLHRARAENQAAARQAETNRAAEQGERAAVAEATVKRLEDILAEAHGHLGAADMQSIESDDQIIMGHVREAIGLLRAGLLIARRG